MMFIDGNSYAYLRSILFFIFRYFGNGETSRKACKQNNRQTINDKNVMHTQKRKLSISFSFSRLKNRPENVRGAEKVVMLVVASSLSFRLTRPS